MEKNELEFPSAAKNAKTVRTVNETFPLPPTRRELVAAVAHILESGGVQKLNLQIGRDIQVTRVVVGDSEAGHNPPEPLQDEDMLDAARNQKIVSFTMTTTPPLSPYQYMHEAFHHLSQKRMTAVGVIINHNEVLEEWLERKSDFQEFFGVPVYHSNQIPRDALLLVAANIEDPQTVVYTLRLELNIGSADETDSGESVEERAD